MRLGATQGYLPLGCAMQVICPFMFDQFYWSERMTWLGVAPPTISSSLLAVDDAQDATREAVSVLAAALSQVGC